MTKYLFKKRIINNNEVSILKSFIYVILWTLLFTSFGFYVNKEIYQFTDMYTSKIEIIEKHIENDDFELAKESLISFSKSWHKDRSLWYKILNHDNFDAICLYLNILEKSINVNDKSKAFEYIVRIKTTLDNILESENFDLNHIM